MEKKVTRVQTTPHLTSAAKFSSSTNTTCPATSHAYQPHPQHQQDFVRHIPRGKQSSQRDYGWNKNRFAAQNRGNNRRPASNQQSNEVNTDRREQRVTEKSPASADLIDRKGRRGESASHLLNFSYSPLPSQNSGRGTGRRPASHQTWRSGWRTKQPVYTKQQFLQAHCQFVVKPPVGNEYMEQLADTDAMVEWEQIEQVILCDEQLASCPICLEVPVSAKITKCAHVYCWPCILHYMSLSEKAWAKCPICFDPIEDKDLKSVSVRTQPKYNVGDEITLSLMRKERDSLYVRPKSEWRPNCADHLYDVDGDGTDVKYSKLLISTISHVESILNNERRQLLNLLHQEDTQSLEASFVQAALDNINDRLEKLGKKVITQKDEIGSAEASSDELLDQESLPAIRIKSAPESKYVSYNDAFDDDLGDIVTDGTGKELCSGSDLEKADSDTRPVLECPPHNVVTAEKGHSDKPAESNTPSRKRNGNSTSSSDSGEGEIVAADLVLPPTGTQPSRQGNKRTEVYYFYQAADGQHVYLHSINTRILAAEYGSLEMAPQTLTATILECEENSMTLDLKKRLKYLNHLPLYCPFTVCEVSLRPPVVSSAVLSHFTEEINQRKRVRNRRQRAETKQYNKAQAEERRRMGKYPDMGLPLDSERHFPVTAPAMSEFLPLAPEVSAEELEPATPSGAAEPQGTTPYSFSQAMKGSPAGPISSAPPPSWPRVSGGAQYVRSRGPQAAASATAAPAQPDSDEETAAPTFKQSFSADFEQMFSKLSVAERVSGEDNNNAETSPAPGSRKKKQKGKKQIMLFSTSGARPNP